MNKIQDIHYSNKEDWQNYFNLWHGKNYVGANNYLDNRSLELQSKFVNADFLNNLTTEYYNLQFNQDENFKTEKIQVSLLPVPLKQDEIYYQINYNESVIAGFNYGVIDNNSTTVFIPIVNITHIIQFFALQNGKEVKTDITVHDIQGDSPYVEFSVNNTVDIPIMCFVIYSLNTDDWNYGNDVLSTTSTNTTINYSNYLIGAWFYTEELIDNDRQLHVVELDYQINNNNFICITNSIPISTIKTYFVTKNNSNITIEKIMGSNQKQIAIAFLGTILRYVALENNKKVITDIEQFENQMIFKVAKSSHNNIACRINYDDGM